MVKIAEALAGGDYGPVTASGIDDGTAKWGLVDPTMTDVMPPDVAAEVAPVVSMQRAAQAAPSVGSLSVRGQRTTHLSARSGTRVWSGPTAV